MAIYNVSLETEISSRSEVLEDKILPSKYDVKSEISTKEEWNLIFKIQFHIGLKTSQYLFFPRFPSLWQWLSSSSLAYDNDLPARNK